MSTPERIPLRGELRHNEPLARHTSWRVGGPAARLYRPADAEDLANFLRGLPTEEPLLWIGLGSNLLVADEGFAGTVIETQGCLAELVRIGPERLRAEAGVASAKAARFAVRMGLTGIEFLAGIPGTIGGALAMNAGAWGAETWDFVSRVRTIDRAGKIHDHEPQDFKVDYRSVQGPPGEWFLSAELRLAPGDPEVGAAWIKELLTQRSATQPTGSANCGSVFRNPPGDRAARLIDSAGLKGVSVGGAVVSEKHANFIINRGDATAADILALIERVQDEVEQKHGIRLSPEVHRVGGEQA
ncbi:MULTISPECIES: UDP-N-acetylmuramate dehydrogenase [Thiorhodovibrio]|uniref:UDP-N-acetylmuramate dehydrogenase n=1 Tax=Thiorhodovibrio TaxID=61593 RepID=UPI001913A927|nr:MULTISPECIES: UDP-N-acetylmuramate dehydrogenase [Thiorhodovibrio]MBK5968228.1 UDP-N-acetylenolpyruvoylglucosamine reductase [Thiorhodovibrio winogradskyi]WPL14782.1 UDP-N-acetylenolpyruvoylglucosamine reductase [Thiorhodovibrio litoralis]